MPKKLLLLVLAGAGGLLAARKAKGQRDEQDLWTEATTAPDLR
ncbi:MAG: hypothetical protein NVSMB13_13430 [Mycobacteriales bacterium]